MTRLAQNFARIRVGVKLQTESCRVKFEAATPADGRHSMESLLLFSNVVLLQSVEIGIFQKERSRVQVGICHKSMNCRRSNSSMESVILSHLCDTFFAVSKVLAQLHLPNPGENGHCQLSNP